MIDPWIKATHLAAMAAWLGGMLANAVLMAAIGRIAVPLGPDAAALVAGLRRWDRRVTLPAMLLTWVFGITLVSLGGWFGSGWLSVKLALVLALSGLHGVQAGQLRRLAGGGPIARPLSGPMLAAAIPVAVCAIAALAVLKPF